MSQDSPYSQATPNPNPAPGYYPVPSTPPTNTMAILSLVFAFVFWPLAILFGHMARKQIARTGESGDGLAVAGLVLGYLFLAITVIAIVAMVALVAFATSNDPYTTMGSLTMLSHAAAGAILH